MVTRTLVLSLFCSLILPACASGYEDYRNIAPVYQVRNSPVPVPKPRLKPAKASKAVVRTAAKPTPKRKATKVSTTTLSATVGKGDTVYAIARRHNAAPKAIISANGLRPPYRLIPGQKLKIPATRFHTIAKGDTLYSVSRRYGTDVTQLARGNKLKAPYRVYVGQNLRFLAAEKRALPAPQSLCSATPPRSGSRFAWPVTGTVISRFGAKQGGLHNDGINIRTAEGSHVRAAEAGVVAYAGRELEGYGNLLLVRHADGWVTAYAHSQKLLVSRGDKVSRGQLIALAGKTGNVGGPQLHFEIRRKSAAVDPCAIWSGGGVILKSVCSCSLNVY